MCYLFELWLCIVCALVYYISEMVAHLFWICTSAILVHCFQVFLIRGLRSVPSVCACLFVCWSSWLAIFFGCFIYTYFNGFQWDLDKMNLEYHVRPTGMGFRGIVRLFKMGRGGKGGDWPGLKMAVLHWPLYKLLQNVISFQGAQRVAISFQGA